MLYVFCMLLCGSISQTGRVHSQCSASLMFWVLGRGRFSVSVPVVQSCVGVFQPESRSRHAPRSSAQLMALIRRSAASGLSDRKHSPVVARSAKKSLVKNNRRVGNSQAGSTPPRGRVPAPSRSSSLLPAKTLPVSGRRGVGGAKATVGRPAAQLSGVAPKVVRTTATSATKIGTSRMSSSLRDVVETWGPKLGRRVAAARQQWHGQRNRVGVSRSQLVKIGTDCSGAEAPIWALKAMQIPHQHVFSCDWQEQVRSFIRATCPPTGHIFTDMLTRRCKDLPGIDIYVCGFPCTPFSLLRQHSTRLLKEAAARPFFNQGLGSLARSPAEVGHIGERLRDSKGHEADLALSSQVADLLGHCFAH